MHLNRIAYRMNTLIQLLPNATFYVPMGASSNSQYKFLSNRRNFACVSSNHLTSTQIIAAHKSVLKMIRWYSECDWIFGVKNDAIQRAADLIKFFV